MKSIVLATTSKYKISLFAQLGLPFETAAPPFEEVLLPGIDPRRQAQNLAAGKALSLRESWPNHLIIGSDQVLALGKEMFTKPQTPEAAVAQLARLRGRTHQLHAAFAIMEPGSDKIETQAVTAHLTFYAELSDQYLERVVAADQSWDCVGGYKYESRGISLIEQIDTPDTNAIVGLPLIALIRSLQRRGVFPDRFSA